jgi:hypothetical protein
MNEQESIDPNSPFEQALTLLVATLACEQCPLYGKCVESECKTCLRQHFMKGWAISD